MCQTKHLVVDVNFVYKFCSGDNLKRVLQERKSLDRRRLEEGLLLYWCLERIREYKLKQLHEMPIPADIDNLIQEVSPLYHEEYIKKWIGE